MASLATLTLAAAVLSAGALGDLYGMRRMYLIGLAGAIAFSALAAAAPTAAVLIVAQLVVDQAPHYAIDAIHTLSLIMAVGPVVAIILALWLIKPANKS